jgi:hypothetical protein
LTERPTFDLSAEDLDTSFKLPDEGWHEVVIDDAEENVKENGNLQYLIKYKSLNDTFKGTVWDFVTVTKPSIQNIMSVSRSALGIDTPTKAKPGPYTPPDADDLIGKELQIEIVHNDDYNKKTDEEGKIIKRAQVRFAGRKRIGEKTGVPASKAGGKAPAKAKATGFSV